MKGIDIFCTSQASTAICLTMEEPSSSSSSSSSIQLGRAIDRFNPIIKDPRRLGKTIPSSSSSSSSSSPVDNSRPLNPHNKNNIKNVEIKKNKKQSKGKSGIDEKRKSNVGGSIMKGWKCTKPGEFISPPGSSRYLLSDEAFLNVISDFDPVLKLVPVETSKTQLVQRIDEPNIPPKRISSSASSSSSRSPDQVVVLRVSLHCRGCERKMRKHISRMEGVSSFNIDFAAKKVTVVGNVTPLDVLNSISKVKNAQLWTPPKPPPHSIKSNSETNKIINERAPASDGPNLLLL
ncbi:hypothetical protein M9H77_03468 [Catharanthus roseus]|uniref:Uncharacterized protein n=1 Tax=Catharanthus roseus TaxID=4058 RepID=A0ACC0CBH8_CATRO|nr:hypothetical protein M9H77_03468 [Catharanthus roseus]